VDLALPSPFEKLIDAQNVIMRTEGRSAFLAEYRTHPEQLHPDIRGQVENTAGYSREQLCAAYDMAANCRSTFDQIAAEYDAVLTLSAVGEAPLGLASTGEMTFNAMWSLLHVPCVNVPGYTGQTGLPIGLTVTGPRFSDRRVLAAADSFGILFDGLDA
jgi:Asp-tRNA(Asn)/Glu-tRNA(Gln) amidotransferase A subunit family amidase